MVGLLAATFCLVTATAHAQCTKDTDCKGDRVCDAGKCVAGPPPAATPPAGTEASPAAPPSPEAVPPAPPAAAAPAPAAPAAPAPIPVVIVPQAEEKKPEMKRHSPAMMAVGIVMVAAAPIVFVTALMEDANCISVDGRCDDSGVTTAALTITGIGLIGCGIPLIIIGAKREPVNGQPAPAARLMPWVSPNSAGATVRLDL